MEYNMHRNDDAQEVAREVRSVSRSELLPGDILLYRESDQTRLLQFGIKMMQALLCHHTHGHYDTTHAGVFLRNDEQGPWIAHIANTGYTVQRMQDYDHINRGIVVFRL